MTTQSTPQPRRTINVVDLSTDFYLGTLTMVTICRASWFEELLMMSDRGGINLTVPSTMRLPQPQDGNVLMLLLDRSDVSDAPRYTIGEIVGILPEHQWPVADSTFDDFVGSLRTCLGQQIRWQATISGTHNDPRIGKIIVQYRTSGRFEIAREESMTNTKISVPRPIA